MFSKHACGPSLNVFKTNLEVIKSKTKALGDIDSCPGNFWKISDEFIIRMERVNYLENKIRHNSFLKDNLIVAKKKFVDI